MNVLIISPIQDKDTLTPVWGIGADLGIPVLQDGLSPHDRSRSYLASRALDEDEFPGIEAFLWIDDDTEATTRDVVRIIKAMEEEGADLVTGVYPCRHAAERGEIALNFNLRFCPGEEMMSLKFEGAGGTYPITACGFGFCLTHRRIFEELQVAAVVPQAQYTAHDGGLYDGFAYFLPCVEGYAHLGEDRSFCSRIQNSRMLVDTRICVGHNGHTLRKLIDGQNARLQHG